MTKAISVAESERLCPACQSGFTPARRDQRFCSSKCRKNNHSRKERKKTPRNSKCSPIKWRENYDLFDRNMRLVEHYAKQKTEAGRRRVIEQVIHAAENGHSQLRSLLTNKRFLFPNRRNSLFFCPGYERFGTIAEIANRYSWVTWGCSIIDVLKVNKEEVECQIKAQI